MSSFEVGSGEVPPEQALLIIESTFELWKAELPQTGPEENIYVAYHFCRWLYDLYGKEVVEFNTSEFDGQEAPDSLKPLLTHQYGSEGFLSGHNRANLRLKPEFDYTPAFVPDYETLRAIKEFDAFNIMVEKAAADPAIYENITHDRVRILDNVLVDFEPHFAKDWGLEFQVNAKEIRVFPYGKRGQTRQPTDYLVGYQDRPNVLALTASQLALLAVKYSTLSARHPVDPETLRSFGGRLTGEVPIMISSRDTEDFSPPPGESIKLLLISRLVEKGLVPPKAASD